MNYNNFYTTLFSYQNYEKRKYIPKINKNRIGVLTMIPAIAITAYLLDLDYEHIKTFYYDHINWCEKYEKYFQRDYERYLNILEYIRNLDIKTKIKEKFPNLNFIFKTDNNPIPYDKFINMYISNIIKYKGLNINKNDIFNSVLYNIDFFSCEIFETDYNLNEIKNILNILKRENKDVVDIDVIFNENKHVYGNIYMKPSFNINDFIELIDNLKNIYKKQIKNSK